MQFIKENLFLVIVAAVVLVVGGAMVFMSSSMAGGVELAVNQRNSVAQQLVRIQNGHINPRQIQVQREYVEAIKASAQGARQECVQWNFRNYKPLELPLGPQGQPIAAFPYDGVNDKIDAAQFSLAFTGQYIEQLQAMRASLNPTTAPRDADIAAHQNQWQSQIQQESQSQTQPATPTGQPTWTSAVQPAAPRGVRASLGADQGVQNLSEEARTLGRQSAIMARATAGQIYADMTSLDRAYPFATYSATRSEDLWFTQINLWVSRDIIEAIRLTNEEAFGRRPDVPRTVPNAAVKRLMSLNIDDQYVAAPSATPGAPGRGAQPTPAVPAGPAGGMAGTDMMAQYLAMESAEEEASTVEEETAPVAGHSLKGLRAAEGLTQRGCTSDYDVLYYDFTVVMPSRYVVALQQHLMAQNYHTIRNITIKAIDVNSSSGGAPALNAARGQGGAPSGHADYYYGPDDVVEVHIEGELLLLADWERGTYDEAARTWTAAPLMPASVLTMAFPDATNAALRPGDRARMPEPVAAPGAAGAQRNPTPAPRPGTAEE